MVNGAETPAERDARLARRNAAQAAHRARIAAQQEANRRRLAPLEAEVEAARAALLAYDDKPKRRALVAAYRAALEKLADARYPNRAREPWRFPKGDHPR